MISIIHVVIIIIIIIIITIIIKTATDAAALLPEAPGDVVYSLIMHFRYSNELRSYSKKEYVLLQAPRKLFVSMMK